MLFKFKAKSNCLSVAARSALRSLKFGASSTTMDLMRPQFVLFGDSITERAMEAPNGWGAKLIDEHATSVDIFNRGFAGALTTRVTHTDKRSSIFL